MTTYTAEDRLRAQVRHALKQADTSQRHVAQALGVSEKYLSAILTGDRRCSLHWAEKVLAVIGIRLLTCTTAPSIERIERVPLGQITHDELDQLYDDLDCYAEVLGSLHERVQHLTEQQTRTADTLSRVHALTRTSSRRVAHKTATYISVNDLIAVLDHATERPHAPGQDTSPVTKTAPARSTGAVNVRR